MPRRDFARLYDQSSGLICQQVPVNSITSTLVESVRDMFIGKVKDFGYVGFSREIDDVFHRRSTYVYITESKRVVMTCRITPRPAGTIMPFEMGLREDGGLYRLAHDQRVVDINTFTYVRAYFDEAMPLLAAGLGYYSKAMGARSAYCLYDVANEWIERVYLSIGFVFSANFPEPVHFPTFCRQRAGRLEPVRWRIMEWNYETIDRHARSAMERYQVLNDP